MISNNDIEVTKVDLTLMSSILLVSHFVNYQFAVSKEELFNNSWNNVALATLLGFALHSLLTNKLSALLINNLELDNPSSILIVYDIIKYGTVFITKEFVSAQLNNRPANFDVKWQMESGFTLLGYIIYDFCSVKLPNVGEKYQLLYNDVVKIGLGELTANFMINHTITTQNLISLGGMLSGIVVYHLFLRNMIVDKKINYFDGYSLTQKDIKNDNIKQKIN